MSRELRRYVFPFWARELIVQRQEGAVQPPPPRPTPRLQVEAACAHVCSEPDFDIRAHTCLPGPLALVPTDLPRLPGHNSGA